MQNLDTVLLSIEQVTKSYFRLLFLVSPKPEDISLYLEKINIHLNVPNINLNLSLSSALLDVPSRQHKIKIHKIVGDIIDSISDEIVIIDKIDILFCPRLHLDVLSLLKNLSRNKTVVAAWPGRVHDGWLQHAEEWHAEYQSHAIADINVLRIDNGHLDEAV